LNTITPGFWDSYTMYIESTLNQMDYTNPLFAILVLSSVFLILESISKKMMPYSVITRKGFFQDFVYIFLYDFLLVFPFYFLFEMKLKTSLFGENYLIYDLNKIPTWAMFITMFILVDFLNWLGHIILHKVPFLWKFHKIHHAQEELGFGSTRHFHWMEYLVFKPLLFIPFSFMGVLVQEYIIFQIWISYTFTFLSHSNIKFNWGFLKYIFITPETHYWHHAKNVKSKHSVNFASILCIWDQLFGYFHLPAKDDQKPLLGLYDDDTPDTFIGQQIQPFKTLLKREKFKNFKSDK